VPFLEHDAPLSPMIEELARIVGDGTLVDAVDSVV
jgi:hypothetical protein